ncbi:MAG: HEAT repeat domain-containing protein [Planctomycetota bacterium]
MYSALILIAVLVFPADDRGGVQWERDYEKGLQKAKDLDIPVFLAFNMDGERANENTALTLYRDPEFIKRTRQFVCLIASKDSHESVEEVVDGQARQACSRFGSVSCEEHLKVEIRASKEYVGRDTVITPQHILILPSGMVVARKAYQASKNDLFKMMEMALKAVARAGKSGDSEELHRLQELKKQALERNADRRDAAIAELGRLPDPEARDALLDLCGSENMNATRLAAIDALATKGNYDALETVIACLKDRQNMVVMHAIVALEKLGLPEAVPVLTKMWNRKPKAIVAKEILRALAKCAPGDPEIRKMVHKAAETSKDSVIEWSAIVAIASLDGEPSDIEVLAKKMRDKSSNVRGLAAWSLGTLKRPEAVPILEGALESETSGDVRECIEAALRNIPIKSGPDDAKLANIVSRFFTEDIER